MCSPKQLLDGLGLCTQQKRINAQQGHLCQPAGEPLRWTWHMCWMSPTATSSCSVLAYISQKPDRYPRSLLMSSGR